VYADVEFSQYLLVLRAVPNTQPYSIFPFSTYFWATQTMASEADCVAAG